MSEKGRMSGWAVVTARLTVVTAVAALLTAPAGAARAASVTITPAATGRLAPHAASAPARRQPRQEQGQEQGRQQGEGQSRRGQRQPQQERQPVGVILDRIDPKTAGPSSPITISGRVTHQSRVAYSGVTVRLRYSPVPLAGRANLRGFADGAAGVPDPPSVAVVQTLKPPQLNPGETRGWRLRTTAQRLRMRSFGVYPISIDVIDGAGRTLGVQRTVITYVPRGRAGVPKPTRVAWIWPIMDRPRRIDDATFVDDKLATELAQNSRLATLVAAGGSTSTPLTWAVDPGLVDDARAMTAAEGYVLSSGRRRPKNAAAGRWLADLKAATNGKELFGTPYADPDMVALVRAGMGKDITDAEARGREILQNKDLLTARTLQGTVWPISGYLDRETIERLRATGVREVLVNSAGVPPVDAPAVTPNASGVLATSQGRVKALVADQTVGQVLAGASRSPGSSVVTEQRFLAETALIGAELPGASRTLIAVPPRRWDPDPQLARALLEDTGSHPWLKPVSLRQVARSQPVRRTLLYPESAQKRELSRRYLAQVRTLHTRIDRFVSIFATPGDNGLSRGVARLESSALRGRLGTGARMRKQLEDALRGGLNKVRILAAPARLAGSSGRVPVTIDNGLQDKTIRVRLEARPQNSLRLQLDRSTYLLEIGPGQKETIKLNMRTRVNGRTTVDLQLETLDRKSLQKTMQLEVRTTAFGRVALTITACAVGVLCLGVGIRVIRRSRRRGEEETAMQPEEMV
jgi:hypothetical protein